MSERSVDGIIPAKSGDKISRSDLEKLKRAARRYRRLLVSAGALVLIFLLGLGVVLISRYFSVAPNPIPISVRQAVSFPTYYPNTNKLPSGYVLDKSSISASQNALVLSITYGHANLIVFTEQPLPKSNDLQQFYAQHIPLRTNLTTSIGQAAISALDNKTFVSLPSTKTWIIITAPTNINQSLLKQVILSIRKS